jgi:hypothetical protein
LGYGVAAFQIGSFRPRDERVYVSYSEPGKQVARFALHNNETLFLLVFSTEQLPAEDLQDALRALHRSQASKLFWIPALADFVIGRGLRDRLSLPNYELGGQGPSTKNWP